jgi:hypothetical protein
MALPEQIQSAALPLNNQAPKPPSPPYTDMRVPDRSEASPLADITEKYRSIYDTAAEKLMASLDERKGQLFDPVLLALSQGFAAPTKTGGFGESLGLAAGLANKASLQQETSARENAMARMQMAQDMMKTGREREKSDLMGSLYKQNPAGQFEMDEKVAQRLSQVTGDPTFMKDIMTNQKANNLRKIGEQMFTETKVEGKEGEPARTVMTFNPNAALQLAKMSDNPVQAITQYADMVPKLRKAGMLGDLKGDTSTPFDAIVLMADALGAQGPAIKLQAKRLAEQYQKGYIDEDKANSLANTMLTMANSTMDRHTSQGMQAIQQAFLRNQATEASIRAQEKLDQQIKEAQSKLTDQQKLDYTKVVLPIINEGLKASTAKTQLAQIMGKVSNAPSGALSGAYASSVGRLFGTDDNTALREIASLSKALVTQIPRLPGAASNLDAKNLEASIGKLDDITLSNAQRVKLIQDIDVGFTKLMNRADEVQTYWESNKKLPTTLLSTAPKPAGTPAPAPAQATPVPAPTAPVTPAAAPARNYPIPTQADIDYAKNNPASLSRFVAKFGRAP